MVFFDIWYIVYLFKRFIYIMFYVWWFIWKMFIVNSLIYFVWFLNIIDDNCFKFFIMVCVFDGVFVLKYFFVLL